MTEHLYNIDYLEQTARLLNDIKQYSYHPFKALTEGMIADVGCGTGVDAINLAKMLGEEVRITGLDYAPEMIEKAQSSAAELNNIEFKTASAESLPFDNDSLAGLRNERLIQHLPEPGKAFAEFYRTLMPGHPLAVVETDWSSIAFYSGNTEVARKLNHYLTYENVKSGFAAANLLRYIREAGFRDIAVELFKVTLRSFQQAVQMLRIDHALQMMQEKEYISSEEYNSFLKALEDADKNHYFVCSINVVIATAIK